MKKPSALDAEKNFDKPILMKPTNQVINKILKGKEVKCTHPDHIDGKTCEDRAVGCNSLCVCCMGNLALAKKNKMTRGRRKGRSSKPGTEHIKPLSGYKVAEQIRKAINGEVEVLLADENQSWNEVWAGNCGVYVGEWYMVFFNDCNCLDYCQKAVRQDGKTGEFNDWTTPNQQPIDLLTIEEYNEFERILENAKKAIEP